MRPIRLAVSAIALGAVLIAAAASQAVPLEPTSPPLSRTITVTGSGHSDVAPDIAIVSLGVMIDAPTAREALDKNNAAMSAVIEGLKGLGFGVTDMQTTGLSLSPQYSYEEQGAPKLEGYQVSNGVTLKIKDVGRLGEILDLVVSKGANQVNSLTFDVADKNAALNDARSKAVADARAKADLMARAAGASVGHVISISESFTAAQPVAVQAMRADAAAAVPIAAGQVGLDAQVSVVYELN